MRGAGESVSEHDRTAYGICNRIVKTFVVLGRSYGLRRTMAGLRAEHRAWHVYGIEAPDRRTLVRLQGQEEILRQEKGREAEEAEAGAGF